MYHGNASAPSAPNESYSTQRLVQSTPGSPEQHGRPNSFEVIGSAESLVGRVSNNTIHFLNRKKNNANFFLMHSRAPIGFGGTGARQIRGSGLHSIHVERNARSTEYDHRRNGHGCTPTDGTKSCDYAEFIGNIITANE